MSEQSRLRWLCRRGMKELDVVLSAYLEQEYAQASSNQQTRFREILELQDPELYALLLGRKQPQDAAQATLVKRLRGIKRVY